MYTLNLLSDGVVNERDPMGELVRVSEFLASEDVTPQDLLELLQRAAEVYWDGAGSKNVFGSHRNSACLFLSDPEAINEINGVMAEDAKRKSTTALGAFVALQSSVPVGYIKVSRKPMPDFGLNRLAYADGSALRTDLQPTHLVDFWTSTTDYDLPSAVLVTIAELTRRITNDQETAYCLVSSDQQISSAMGSFALDAKIIYPWTSPTNPPATLVAAHTCEEVLAC